MTTRELITEAILDEYRLHGPRNQEHIIRESIKYIVSDGSLICFAQELGVDTDRVLSAPRPA